jgi:hypothetical protein
MKMHASKNQQRAAQKPDAGKRDQKGEMPEMGDARRQLGFRLGPRLKEEAGAGLGQDGLGLIGEIRRGELRGESGNSWGAFREASLRG